MKALHALTIASVLVLIGCGTTSTNVTSDFWVPMEGPHAQDLTALLMSAGTTPTLLAGTENGEVYSANPGGAWKQISTIRKETGIHRFIRDPDKPTTLYAATDAGLFVSADEGASWTEIPAAAGATGRVGVRTLAIDPWNTTVMFAGTMHSGIRRSSDGGMTWSPANEGIPGLDSADFYDILIDLSRPDRILAATSPFGVVLSNDAGKSWRRLTEEFTTTSSAVTHLVQNAQTPSTVVYGTDAGSIRKSTDGGVTWIPTRNGFAEGKVLSLSAIPGHPETLLAGTESGILISSDFGTSWRDITGALPQLPLVAVPSSDGQTIYVFGEGIGLQKSTDSAATWTHTDDDLGGATIRFLVTDESGKHLYAALEHAVLAYDSTTKSWVSASSGLPGGMITSLVVDSDSPLHLYAATTLGGFQTTNGGQSWRTVTRNMRITPKILEPHPRIHTRMLSSSSLGLDISTDRGATWRQTKPLLGKYHVSAFTFAPKNTGVIYGAAPEAILMSRDGGFLWESSRYGLHSEEFVAITLDNQDPSLVYAWTTSGGGYRSLDGGLEWNKYTPPWQQYDTVLVAFDRFQPSSVVAVVNGRQVYYSPSGGGTWFPLHSLKFNAQLQSLWWNSPGGTLYVGTRGKGVYRVFLGHSIAEVAGEREVAKGEQ